jgi:aminopeptidase N
MPWLPGQTYNKLFERVTQRNLSWFFRQWADENGQPHITIKEVDVKNMKGKFTVNLVLRQEGRPKRLALPVTFNGLGGDHNFQVELDQKEKRYSFLLDFPPHEVIIDK